MSITFLCNLVRGGKDYMDLKHAQALQAAWEKLGNASCPHSTLKLVKTAGGYFTGEYGCTTCGKTFEGTSLGEQQARVETGMSAASTDLLLVSSFLFLIEPLNLLTNIAQ
jgi:transposase-like protein